MITVSPYGFRHYRIIITFENSDAVFNEERGGLRAYSSDYENTMRRAKRYKKLFKNAEIISKEGNIL